MNYYIDFEAAQFTNKIISIGCVREDGKEFYSLVNVKKKLSNFIIELTGITQEDINDAPEVTEVFEKFYDWCNDEDGVHNFICYGNSDVEFLKATYKDAKSFKSNCILCSMIMTIKDCVPSVKKHFGLKQSIGLMRIVNYYRNTEEKQKHNALEDAKMLKYVYEHIQENENEFDAFKEEKLSQQIKKNGSGNITVNYSEAVPGNMSIYRMKNGKVIDTYANIREAANWAISNVSSNDKPLIENVEKSIRRAIVKKERYFCFRWKIES